MENGYHLAKLETNHSNIYVTSEHLSRGDKSGSCAAGDCVRANASELFAINRQFAFG